MSEIKERPSWPMLDFEVVAILDGRKTQTRRVIKPQPQIHDFCEDLNVPALKGKFVRNGMLAVGCHIANQVTRYVNCPHGNKGDRLWVREKHCFLDVVKSAMSGFPLGDGKFWPDVWNLDVEYSDGTENEVSVEGDKPKQTRERGETQWRSSIHMPRWASRIDLEITGIRVERLQDISEEDAISEGITGPHDVGYQAYRVPDDSKPRYSNAISAYESLWESINGHGSWDANPWVWVIEFRRLG